MEVHDAKYIAAFVLGAITFVSGMLAVTLLTVRRKYLLLTSSFLCFGAGVLLATSVIHMLPEAYDRMPDRAGLAYCAGFLLMYLIDEIITFHCFASLQQTSERNNPVSNTRREYSQHTLYDENSFDSNNYDGNVDTQHGNCLTSNHPRRFSSGKNEILNLELQDEARTLVPSTSKQHTDTDTSFTNYGSISLSESNILDIEKNLKLHHSSKMSSNSLPPVEKSLDLKIRDNGCCSECIPDVFPPNQESIISSRQSSQDNVSGIQTVTFQHHISYPRSKSGYLGLYFALLFHTVLEGMAVGLEESVEDVYFLSVVLACHKLIVAFCFGLEVTATGKECYVLCIQILLFSLGSLLGVFAGSLMESFDHVHSISGPTIPILQALAGGSLLYVTVYEIMSRERLKWDRRVQQRYAGLVQFAAVAVGFTVMFLVDKYIGCRGVRRRPARGGFGHAYH
ncbi:uncharacterized protein [Periplaneta americana]|uniref:uncharacterized protein isoform X2 n=1 Tax=Periplaneta americana TaxID=6978 RepID=UPI0037E87D83